MPDLLLGDDTHDLVFINGDFQLTTTESLSLKQRLTIKLRTIQPEWFLDTTLGIDYYGSIFGKGRAKQSADAIFKNAILEEPEVIQLLSFQSSIDSQYRIYSLSFTVQSSDADEPIPVELQL